MTGNSPRQRFRPSGVYYYVLTARLVNGDPHVRKGYWQGVR